VRLAIKILNRIKNNKKTSTDLATSYPQRSSPPSTHEPDFDSFSHLAGGVSKNNWGGGKNIPVFNPLTKLAGKKEK